MEVIAMGEEFMTWKDFRRWWEDHESEIREKWPELFHELECFTEVWEEAIIEATVESTDVELMTGDEPPPVIFLVGPQPASRRSRHTGEKKDLDAIYLAEWRKDSASAKF